MLTRIFNSYPLLVRVVAILTLSVFILSLARFCMAMLSHTGMAGAPCPLMAGDTGAICPTQVAEVLAGWRALALVGSRGLEGLLLAVGLAAGALLIAARARAGPDVFLLRLRRLLQGNPSLKLFISLQEALRTGIIQARLYA